MRRRVVNDDAARIEAVLPPFFQPHRDAGDVARRARDDVMLVGHFRHDAVVIDHAGLGQHEAVADAAGLQGGNGVVGIVVDQRAGIRPQHLDLAERRAVEDGHRLARQFCFALDFGVGVARAVIGGAQPAAIFAEHRANGAMLVLQRQPAHRIEQLAAPAAGNDRERHRHEGRPVGRGAGVGDAAAGDRRHRGKAVHVGGLALVGRHAERRVALEMLDRAEILARRKLDILNRHVVLEVDPLAALWRRAAAMPARRHRSHQARTIAAARRFRRLPHAPRPAVSTTRRCHWRRRRR